MKHVTPWVSLDVLHFSDAVADDASMAGRFRSLPSPSMLPTKARLGASESWNDFFLEFEYLTSEKVVSGDFAENLKIFYGSSSKRIRKLNWIKADLRDAAELHRLVSIALEKFSKVNLSGFSREDSVVATNSKAIRNAIKSAAPELIRYLKEVRDAEK